MLNMTLAARALAKSALPALGAFMITTAANAQVTFTNANDTTGTMSFNGFVDQGATVIDGLTGDLSLTLVDNSDPTHWQFSYTLTNTSSSPITASVITGFGFNADQTIDIATSTIDSGLFTTFGSGQISQGPGFDVDLCVKSGPNDNNCAGGQGNSGLNLGDSATGTFTLEFASAIDTLTLGDFTLRYQGIAGPNGTPESAIGQRTDLPEPASWAMMLLGFGATGFVIRRSRKQLVSQIA